MAEIGSPTLPYGRDREAYLAKGDGRDREAYLAISDGLRIDIDSG